MTTRGKDGKFVKSNITAMVKEIEKSVGSNQTQPVFMTDEDVKRIINREFNFTFFLCVFFMGIGCGMFAYQLIHFLQTVIQ